MVGIYQIRNTVNGKRYIGQSENLSHRKSCHFYNLVNQKHGNRYLQEDYNQNPEAFVFEILCKCGKEDLLDLEKFYIEKYKSSDRKYGYNIESGGLGPERFAEETKDRISKAKFGNKCMVGKKLTDSWKRNLALAQPHRKKVECIETGEVFESFSDAARKTGLNRTKIVSVCTGKRKKTGGLHFRYVEQRTSD